MNEQVELDLHEWLSKWASTASESEVRSKFREIVTTFLTEDDIAYIFYNSILLEYPEEESRLDSILEGLRQ